MGMTLRSAERRHRNWIKAGGLRRVRAEVERYDLRSMRRLSAPFLDELGERMREAEDDE